MSRTLPPSKQKLKKQREQGDVAKSPDLTGAIMAVSIPAILVFNCYLFKTIENFFRKSLSMYTDFSTNNMLLLLAEAATNSLFICLVLLLFFVLMGFIAEVSQVGFHFSWKSVRIDFSRISLGKGIRRLLGLSEDEKSNTGFPVKFYEIVKMGLHVGGGAGFGVALSIIASSIVVSKSETEIFNLAQILAVVLGISWICISLFFLVGGITDLLIQKKIRTARLRMNLEELKRELKDSEGSHELKQARKESHNQLLLHGILQGVRSAKVLIVNRTKT